MVLFSFSFSFLLRQVWRPASCSRSPPQLRFPNLEKDLKREAEIGSAGTPPFFACGSRRESISSLESHAGSGVGMDFVHPSPIHIYMYSRP